MVRGAWAVLPFTLGPSLADALGERAPPVRTVASVALWAGWAVVLLATLVPRPLGLTALRVAAPAAVAASLAAALTADDGPVRTSELATAVPVAAACFTLVVTWLHQTTMVFVNGPAYPNERRFPLRIPAPLLIGIVPAAWCLAIGPPAAGGLLLAAEVWAPGAAVLVVGLPMAGVLLRALHGLSRRWVVFVPAGVVLHDPMALTDPVLFRRQIIQNLGPAPVGADALDLTQRAPGLALELALREEVPMVLTKPGRRVGQAGSWDRLLFTPTRPGAVLAEAARRRIPSRRAV